MAATTKTFVASSGVSLMRLMLAHYDRYDDQIGIRALRMQGNYVNDQGIGGAQFMLSVQVTGSDLIETEKPYPGNRQHLVMQTRSWWIRGRLLTGEEVEGYFNPRNQVCVLEVKQR